MAATDDIRIVTTRVTTSLVWSTALAYLFRAPCGKQAPNCGDADRNRIGVPSQATEPRTPLLVRLCRVT